MTKAEISAPRKRATAEPSTNEISTHIDEADCDIEHTLKRLTIEKRKERDKDFGLYL